MIELVSQLVCAGDLRFCQGSSGAGCVDKRSADHIDLCRRACDMNLDVSREPTANLNLRTAENMFV